MWKILWHDARRAAQDGDSERAAELYTITLFEAQRMVPEDDPNFEDFLKERNQFYEVYGQQIQTVPKIGEPSTQPNRSEPEDCDTEATDQATDHGNEVTGEVTEAVTDEITVWRLCSRCGRSSAQCCCLPFAQSAINKASRFQPGDLIARNYQVVRVLGSGGMAFVYLVRDDSNKLFAMKILNREFTDDQEVTERFEREAQVIRKMRHPNIISVSDFGKMADGRSYFVMDFVDGLSLLSLLEKERRLGMTRACRIFLQICDAMAHAHNFGVIHRDLKPSNIILLTENNKNDQVRIVDFGIAKTNPIWGETDSRLTQDGQVVGSPAYMSPEQCLGDQIDHRSDIYSVGCAMYQSLCGVPPFSAANSMALLLRHINDAPPTNIPLPSGSVLPRLENIVLRALAKDPDQRYQSMVDMEQELLEFMIEDLELSRL